MTLIDGLTTRTQEKTIQLVTDCHKTAWSDDALSVESVTKTVLEWSIKTVRWSIQTMTDANFMLWSVLWGSIGLGYFIYGKKQRKVVPLFAGIGIMAAPYFVANAWWMMSISLGLMLVAYFVRLE